MPETENGFLNRPYFRFMLAVAAVAAAFSWRTATEHYFGIELPTFITVYPAVMVAATLGGFWPGMLATGLAALGTAYWVFPHRGLAVARASDLVALSIFAAMGVGISTVAERYRRGQQKLAAYEKELALDESNRKLRQSEEQFETLANAIPQLCWMANADGWIFWYNQRWYKYTGTTPADMEGWGWQTVHDPEELPKVLERWKASIATGEPFEMVFPLKCAEGVFHPFLTRVTPVKDDKGEVVRWFGTNTEVTELRKTQDALRESERRLRLAQQAAKIGVFEWNVQTGVNAWSPELEAMYGLAPGEFGNTQPAWEQLVHPEDRAAAVGTVNRAFETSEPVEGEWRVLWPDGSVHWIVGRFQVFYDDSDGRKPLRLSGVNIDITERKQAEETVRESEERFRVAQELSPDGFLIFRPLRDNTGAVTDFLWIYENDAAARMNDTDPKKVCGKRVSEILPHHDQTPFHRAYKEVAETGEVRVVEEAVYGHDTFRQPRWFRVAAVPTAGADVAILVQNVTERKQVERALEAERELLRTIVNHLPAAVLLADGPELRLRIINPAYQMLAPGKEIAGKTLEEVWPEIGPNVPALFRHVLETGESHHSIDERFLIRRSEDGPLEEAYFSWSVFRVRVPGNGHWGLLNTAWETTQRKKIEDALRASEERWATTLKSIGDAVISTDANGKVEFMNDVAQKLTGWSLTEARGRELGFVFNIVQEVTRIRPESPVAKVIRLGKIVGLANHTVLVKHDGTEIPIEDSAAPILDKKGEIEGVVLVFHDVSEQRRAERVLRTNERLATTGRLAATIAHEIHNPLDAVGNLLYLLDEGTKDETQRGYLKLASSELGRVTQMTHQMLTFQREAAKPIPVQMGEILESVVLLYGRKVQAAGITIEKEVDDHVPIMGFPGELRQVVANLFGNAIEALRSGKGKIALRTLRSRDWRNGRSGLRVVIADNGPGIPAAIRSQIFEPFFTTKGESGTGLGLWITADIVRKYDGTIRLWSSTTPGRSGTCFSVFFPFAATTESQAG